MTRDQLKYYLLHPTAWLRWKWAELQAWRRRQKARKIAHLFMVETRQMEANLKAAAYPSCPKCYGQGQRGFNLTTKQWAVCSCTFNPRTQDKIDAHPWLKG